MKEKTFEELINDLQKVENNHESFVNKFQVESLLKQVREATIKECKEKVTCYLNADKIFNDLPTYKIPHF